MRKVLFVLLALFAVAMTSCKHEVNNQEAVKVSPLEHWKDSIGKTTQTLVFMGDTLGETVSPKSSLYRANTMDYYENKIVSIKYAENGEVEVEKNVHVTYYVFNGKLYEISIETDNASVFDMILNSYMKRFGYPKDEEGDYIQDLDEDGDLPDYGEFSICFKNTSFVSKSHSNEYGTPMYDRDFNGSTIYYIELFDERVREAREKYKDAEEKHEDEEYIRQEEIKQHKTDSLSSALENQFAK